MEILACGFAALIASDIENPQDAEPYYGREYARHQILGNPDICRSGYEDMIGENTVDLIKAERV